ncbi:MAG TPA: hypothetical protein VK756_02560 [Solirubrobacteraceae bacterium]|jgi:hypothetical protein|nr:hypothetical protein [Solirubrobacteraceae bacterium]
MSQPDRPGQFDRAIERRYGRWVGALAIVILALITLNTVLTKPNGAAGLAPGAALPPFAVPLASGDLRGAANVSTGVSGRGGAKSRACAVRGPRILNICALYESGPLVLALFIDASGCARILTDMQTLVPQFPGVRFAAVSIKGDRGALRALVHKQGLSFPVGIDEEGTLVALYKTASCPQVTFAYPGGVTQGKALLLRPPLATLRARVEELVAGSRARGWSPGA